MTTTLIQQLKDALSNPSEASQEKLQNVIQEALKTFYQLQGKLSSPEKKDREEAMETALALKEALEEQTNALCKSVGLEPTELAKFVEDPSNFSKEQWEFLGAARGELEGFRQEMLANKTASERTLKKKNEPARTSSWIAG